jgi:nitrite reductase/ring-hydroxylating ferredoxin subunit
MTLTKAMFASGPSATPTSAGEGAWMTVGAASSVAPGDIKAFSTPGGPVAVANAAGTLYAFDDTCTHKHCSLAEGDLDGTVVTCICHGSEFDVTTGAVRQGPAESPVGSYPVRVEGTDLQIRR